MLCIFITTHERRDISAPKNYNVNACKRREGKSRYHRPGMYYVMCR
jgi:hypothetical protein